MAYTRQYTQGVGWENTPSINTPISAENLNQMDNAIMNIDAAIAAALAGGIGAECSGHEITRLASNNEAIYADILFDDDIVNHDTHIFFLTSEYAVPEKSDSPYYWRLWVRYKIESTTMGQNIMIYDMDGEPFDDAIPVGNQFICQLHIVDPSDSTTWYISELANISVGSGGGSGCRIFSDHITEQDDTNLYTSTNVFDGTSSQEGDLLFLRCDVDAVWPSPPLPLPGWGISFGHGSGVEYGSITDARRGEGSVMPGFYDSISSGTTLIISKHGNNDWFLRAVIPVASGGGGTHTDAINFKITSASSNTLVPVAFQRIAAPLNDGDLVFLYMSVNGTFDSEASATSWQLQYKLTDSTTITGSIANGLGSPSVSIFNSNLPQGTWLVLKSGVYDSTTHTQGFTCIAKIDPASGGGTGNNVFTWDSQYTDASTNDFEVTLSEMPSFSIGDILVLKIHANLTYTGSNGWGFLITIGSSGEGWSGITKKVSTASGYDVVDFTDDLSRGTCLTFICTDVANSGMPTLLLVSKDTGEGGASTLAGLSDTNIVSPTDQQYLKYNATSGKWENVSATKTFVKATPNMTGPTTPSGVVSASSEYNINYSAWYAFNGVYGYDQQTWATSGGHTTGEWIQYLFGTAKIIKKIATVNRNEGNVRAIKTFKLQGSNDGTTFTDLASCEIMSGSAGYRQEFDINNDTAYLYYRLYVTEPWIPNDMTVGLAELELFEEVEVEVAELNDLVDVDITSPTAAQPLTYDAANSKWVNGGVIPAANGGTGNNSGYVRAGQKANTTIGTQATAEGDSTTASGMYSHAEGQSTTASGFRAHADGYNTVASADCSHASGNFTVAGYANQFVVGKYNDNKSANIFEVGIGTANNAKANGLELDTSGNLKVAGTITDGNGNNLSALASYLEQTVTLSTSASTTVTFTDASITANSFIEYACSQWDLVPESITGAAGSCTIVLPKVDSAQSVTVRIYVR